MTELTAQQRTWTRREGGGKERRHSNCKSLDVGTNPKPFLYPFLVLNPTSSQ
jgi:hypothetical protein